MLIHIHWLLGVALCFPLLIGAFEQGRYPPEKGQVFRYFVYYLFTWVVNLSYYVHLWLIWRRLESRMFEMMGGVIVLVDIVFLIALKPWKGRRKEPDYYTRHPPQA